VGRHIWLHHDGTKSQSARVRSVPWTAPVYEVFRPASFLETFLVWRCLLRQDPLDNKGGPDNRIRKSGDVEGGDPWNSSISSSPGQIGSDGIINIVDRKPPSRKSMAMGIRNRFPEQGLSRSKEVRNGADYQQEKPASLRIWWGLQPVYRLQGTIIPCIKAEEIWEFGKKFRSSCPP